MQPEGDFRYEPDPEHPGWHTWELRDETRFNGQALGRMLIRREGERAARTRLLEVEQRHSNVQGNVHGGVTLAIIDVALFGTMRTVLGGDAAGAVTVDLHNQFVGAGIIGQPLDVICEVVRETRRLVFLRGIVEQGDNLVGNFVATLRKPSAR